MVLVGAGGAGRVGRMTNEADGRDTAVTFAALAAATAAVAAAAGAPRCMLAAATRPAMVLAPPPPSTCLMLRAPMSSRAVQPFRHAQVLRRQDHTTILILRTGLRVGLGLGLVLVVRVRQRRGARPVVGVGNLPRGGGGQGRVWHRRPGPASCFQCCSADLGSKPIGGRQKNRRRREEGREGIH